jgi:TRAP-type uncharacterized transport system fused permease subunit
MTAALSHRQILRVAITAIAVAMALYHIWAIAFGTPEAFLFRGTHLLFGLTLAFLIYRATTLPHDGPADEVKKADDRLPNILDYLLVAASATAIVYLFVNYEYVVTRIYYIDDLSWSDMTLAVVLTLLVLEGTRRVIGLALPITALVFLFYGLFIARLEP